MQAVCPGDRLGSTGECSLGAGTFEDDGYVYSSRCGFATAAVVEGKTQWSVVKSSDVALVPSVGDVVTAKVLKMTPRFVVTEMQCIGSQALPAPFTGVVRVQDVRALEVDKVVMSECFRPGDLIRAEVLSLGTMRDYYLTTAKNELGVIWARSLAGAPLVAVSWEQMRCPVTNQTEARKVAKL